MYTQKFKIKNNEKKREIQCNDDCGSGKTEDF